MFRLIASFDNSIQVSIRDKETLHRVYSRRYLGKIPMPTFDFGPHFCCCCPAFLSRTESCAVFIEKGCWPIKGWLTAAPFDIHDAVLIHASFWERFPQEAKRQFTIGAVFDNAGNQLPDWCSVFGLGSIVRRTKPFVFDICPGCGRANYVGGGSPYVCFRDPGGMALLSDDGFLLSDDLAASFDFTELKKHHILVERVKHVRKPKDGLPSIISYRHNTPALELVDWFSDQVCAADKGQAEDFLFDDLAVLCDTIRAVRLNPIALVESCLAKVDGHRRNALEKFLDLPPERQSLRRLWWVPGHVYPEDMDNSEYENCFHYGVTPFGDTPSP